MTAARDAFATRAYDFHGLRVVVRGAVDEAVARLFAALPPSLPILAADEATVETLTITLAPRDPTERTLDAGAGFRPSFFHGPTRVLERDGAFTLVAPSSRIDVSGDGLRIDASVDRAGVDGSADPTVDPRVFANTTLFIALCIALRRRGLFHLHAGGMIREGGTGVLVIGDSGAGKSTVTVTLLDAGTQHLGDDAIFVTERAGRPALLAFPKPFHLAPATRAAFPSLPLSGAPPAPSDAARAKRDVAIDALPGRRIARMDAPDLVLFPRVTSAAESRVVPLTPDEAFGHALRASALVAVDGAVRTTEHLALLAELLHGARTFALHLGADWLADPRATAARCLPL